MADPQHVPVLDGFDRLTVRLYRGGLAVATLGVLGLAVDTARGGGPRLAVAVLVGVLLAVGNMHLYDKRIRWVIAASAHVGAVLVGLAGFAADAVVGWAGAGFLFVALSAFALKERFCFRVPGLRAVPAFLAASLVPAVLGVPLAAAALLGVAAVPLAVLTVAKMRMPLHFDIGNKAHYQV